MYNYTHNYTYDLLILHCGYSVSCCPHADQIIPQLPALGDSFSRPALAPVDVFEMVPQQCVHDRPMYVVCPDVLRTVGETS